MSCIVAHRSGWIIGDTRLSGGGEICVTDVKKVQKAGKHSLVSAVGSFSLSGLVERVITDTAEANTQVLVDQLCQFFQTEGDSVDGEVVVVGDGKIYVVTTGYYYRPLDAYHANGSGRGVAYGYLKGLEKCGRVISMQDAGDAIRLSSTVDVGVNDRLFGLSLAGDMYI